MSNNYKKINQEKLIIKLNQKPTQVDIKEKTMRELSLRNSAK